jgi:hypothetical protein
MRWIHLTQHMTPIWEYGNDSSRKRWRICRLTELQLLASQEVIYVSVCTPPSLTAPVLFLRFPKSSCIRVGEKQRIYPWNVKAIPHLNYVIYARWHCFYFNFRLRIKMLLPPYSYPETSSEHTAMLRNAWRALDSMYCRHGRYSIVEVL